MGTLALALAVVMAGSGHLDTFKLLRGGLVGGRVCGQESGGPPALKRAVGDPRERKLVSSLRSFFL